MALMKKGSSPISIDPTPKSWILPNSFAAAKTYARAPNPKPMANGPRLSTVQYRKKLRSGLRLARLRQMSFNAFSTLRSIRIAVTNKMATPNTVSERACSMNVERY